MLCGRSVLNGAGRRGVEGGKAMLLIARIASTAFLLIYAVAVAAGEDELEIHGSLSGYNLLSPEARCCALSIHLMPNGKLSTVVQIEAGPHTQTSHIAPGTIASLRNAIVDARFFSLPRDVGAMPVNGDEHKMEVRIGSRSHTVVLHDWPDNWEKAPYLSRSELDRTRRAYSVWRIIRNLVNDPKALVP
jgi:hypothetical protein